jgi:aspartyl-tRNA(Asn)/glutamyl-tRNA(Gln) amidotransferase subunit A
MNLPPRMTIAQASRLLRSQPSQARETLTSQDLCLHSLNLATFGENSLHLNAYAKLLSTDEIAEQARASDDRIKSGRAKSLLDGIPVTIKANIAVGRWWDIPHACSAILTHETSGKADAINDNVYESDIARKLLSECGAVLIGITNMDEFGMGSLGAYNGVGKRIHPDSTKELDGRHSGQYPTFNPLPWMQMISKHQMPKPSDLDELFLRQIHQSTPLNPHGIGGDALKEVLEEVQYWIDNYSRNKDTNSNFLEYPLFAPGGSSSGAATATAHGSSLLSIGTDTGGSLRLPAAWTSTVGFKPTYGTFSRHGVVSYASSLDTVGFITGSAECADIAWRCLTDSSKNNVTDWDSQVCRDATARIYHSTDKGKNDKLPNSSAEAVGERSGDDERPLEGIKIGIPSAFSLKESPSLISSTWSEGAKLLESKGATLVTIPEAQVSSQWVKLSCAAYYVLACAEASSNLSRYDGVRYGMEVSVETQQSKLPSEHGYNALSDMTILEQRISATRACGFGDEVQRRVLAGTSVLSSDRFHIYEAAAIVRAKLSQSLDNVFSNSGNRDSNVDVILVPTALSFPVALDPQSSKQNELDSTSAFANDVMTIPISLGGFPSISVPSRQCDKHNYCVRNVVGLQVFGPKGLEELVLKAASILDSNT